jgi:hypothetical protein
MQSLCASPCKPAHCVRQEPEVPASANTVAGVTSAATMIIAKPKQVKHHSENLSNQFIRVSFQKMG